jgi:hypothetical protein
MTEEQQAKKLIDEAWEYSPSSGATRDALAVQIATWCAEKIALNLSEDVNNEYWNNVIKIIKQTKN